MFDELSKKEQDLVILLAMHDISGGNDGAWIPQIEVERYVLENLDSLLERVSHGLDGSANNGN